MASQFQAQEKESSQVSLEDEIVAELEELEASIAFLRRKLEELLSQELEPADGEGQRGGPGTLTERDGLARAWLSIAVTRANEGDLAGATRARANAAVYSGRVSPYE